MFFLGCSTALLNFAKLELSNAEITAPLSLSLSLSLQISLWREKKRSLVSWHESALCFDTVRAAVLGTLRSTADKSPRRSDRKKLLKRSRSWTVFPPVAELFPLERQERQKNRTRGCSKFCPPRSIRYFRYKVLSGGNVPAWQGFSSGWKAAGTSRELGTWGLARQLSCQPFLASNPGPHRHRIYDCNRREAWVEEYYVLYKECIEKRVTYSNEVRNGVTADTET